MHFRSIVLDNLVANESNLTICQRILLPIVFALSLLTNHLHFTNQAWRLTINDLCHGSSKPMIYWTHSYYSDLTLSQSLQPMTAHICTNAEFPLAKILARVPCCSSETAPWRLLPRYAASQMMSLADDLPIFTWSEVQISKTLYSWIIWTHCDRDIMAFILQTTLSNTSSWIKIYELKYVFHCSLFLKVQSIICHHCINNGLASTRRQTIIWSNGG